MPQQELTQRQQRAARDARDGLGDLFELIGVSRTVLRVQQTDEGTSVIAFSPLDPATVRTITDTLIKGCLGRAPQVGVAVWSESLRCVAEVTDHQGPTVWLRTLAGSRELRSAPGDLRLARIQEVRAALAAR